MVLTATTAALADPPLRVVCTTTELAALVASIGGQAVHVQAIVRGPQDPHHVQAKPSMMRLLNKADLLVYNGLQLEIGWLPLLIEGARNPRISAQRLGQHAAGQLDASATIAPLEIPTGHVDRSMGDVHAEGNPHYMLDPRNAALVARAIAGHLSRMAPDRAEQFEGNLRVLLENLQVRQADWEQRAANWRGTEVISYHKQFEYLADWLGIAVTQYVEDRPGIPPGPRHIAELINYIKQHGIPIILQSTFADPKAAKLLAERTGARVVELPAAVGADDATDDYLQLMETIVRRLETGFREVSGEH